MTTLTAFIARIRAWIFIANDEPPSFAFGTRAYWVKPLPKGKIVSDDDTKQCEEILNE